MTTSKRIALLALLALALGAPLACGGERAEPTPLPEDLLVKVDDRLGKADASAEAVFLDFAFEGELETNSSWNVEQEIEDQLLYTVGLLNGERSVGRLDRLQLSAVQTEPLPGGGVRISYHAQLPVAWGRRNQVPTSYTLRLPRDMSYGGQQRFTDSYKDSCVDWSAHDVDVGSMWYYFRPDAYNCQLAEQDVVTTTATVTPSAIATTGKFPEYDKVWQDGVLRVVAVFGKYEDGATSNYDAGISAYNTFTRMIKSELTPHGLQTIPADLPYAPGVDLPDITFSAQIDAEHAIEVVALLVDNVRTAGYAFDQRYAQLSRDADLIAYNGHSGLGANIRALARKGHWVTGQYAIVFMNGCDTYAYVDSSLADAHAAVNPDDPVGTKYVDIVMNAMPAYFREDAPATMALIRGLLRFEAPRTYEQIFVEIDSSQVVLVSGEQDNTFVPGGGGGGEPWEGLEADGTLARGEEVHFETPLVEAGAYRFELSGTNDADLYVRIGSAPTVSEYDCRPYLSGSAETCLVDLPAAAKIFFMVRGYATSSDFQLVGRPD